MLKFIITITLMIISGIGIFQLNDTVVDIIHIIVTPNINKIELFSLS